MINVLIVEDEPLIAEAHRTYLTRLQGFSVSGGRAHGPRRDAVAAGGARRRTRRSTWCCSTSACPTPAVSRWRRRCPGCGLRPTSSPSPPSATWRWCAPRSATARWPICSSRSPLRRSATAWSATAATARRCPREPTPPARPRSTARWPNYGSAPTGRLAPKGAAPGTNDEIARAVRDPADGLTADEVAKRVGVSRVTAWRYLERLADEGTVIRRTDYGKAGRPRPATSGGSPSAVVPH